MDMCFLINSIGFKNGIHRFSHFNYFQKSILFFSRDLLINTNIVVLILFGSDLFLSSTVWQYCRIINYNFKSIQMFRKKK